VTELSDSYLKVENDLPLQFVVESWHPRNFKLANTIGVKDGKYSTDCSEIWQNCILTIVELNHAAKTPTPN